MKYVKHALSPSPQKKDVKPKTYLNPSPSEIWILVPSFFQERTGWPSLFGKVQTLVPATLTAVTGCCVGSQSRFMDIKDRACLYGTSQHWRPTMEHYWNKQVIIWTVILRDKIDATGKVTGLTTHLHICNQKFPRNAHSVHSVLISASGIATRQISN